jgi:hypothetical protein
MFASTKGGLKIFLVCESIFGLENLVCPLQFLTGSSSKTSHNIDCILGSLCYIRTVFHLNGLTAQLSFEERAAVEGAK